MAELLRMPEVLANSAEALIQSWNVTPGQPFDVGDVIATMETEKAIVDVEAEQSGSLVALLVDAGATAEVGTPIAVIAGPGETVDDVPAVLASLGVGAPASSAGARAPMQPGPESSTALEAVVAQPDAGTGRRIFASPLARRLAKEHGLVLEELAGSGPRGRIRRVDVDAAIAAVAPSPAPVASSAPPESPTRPAPADGPTPSGGFTDEPHSRLRRAVARRLTESKQSVPHFYLDASCRMDRLVALRAQLKAAAVAVSVNDLVVKAAAVALREVPELNVIWTADAVRRLNDVDIAVAVAGDRGLVTPVLRQVDTLSVGALAQQVRDLVERASAGRLHQDELEGGALSVTNLGMFGTESFAAIINPPQAAILAVGAIRDKAVVDDGAVVPGKVMRVTLSVDHRPVDGVVAARWLSAFVEAVENPLRLLV